MPLPRTAGDLTGRHVSAPVRSGPGGALLDNNRPGYLFAIRAHFVFIGQCHQSVTRRYLRAIVGSIRGRTLHLPPTSCRTLSQATGCNWMRATGDVTPTFFFRTTADKLILVRAVQVRPAGEGSHNGHSVRRKTRGRANVACAASVDPLNQAIRHASHAMSCSRSVVRVGHRVRRSAVHLGHLNAVHLAAQQAVAGRLRRLYRCTIK